MLPFLYALMAAVAVAASSLLTCVTGAASARMEGNFCIMNTIMCSRGSKKCCICSIWEGKRAGKDMQTEAPPL